MRVDAGRDAWIAVPKMGAQLNKVAAGVDPAEAKPCRKEWKVGAG